MYKMHINITDLSQQYSHQMSDVGLIWVWYVSELKSNSTLCHWLLGHYSKSLLLLQLFLICKIKKPQKPVFCEVGFELCEWKVLHESWVYNSFSGTYKHTWTGETASGYVDFSNDLNAKMYVILVYARQLQHVENVSSPSDFSDLG